jgi:hypothetical protein
MQIILQTCVFRFVQMVLTPIIQAIDVYKYAQMFRLISDTSKSVYNLARKIGSLILRQDYVFNRLIAVEILMEILPAKNV